MVSPNLIRRQCGGWLAVSPSTEGIKIGATGGTEAEAEERYRDALARWRSLDISAANTRATDPTYQPLPPRS